MRVSQGALGNNDVQFSEILVDTKVNSLIVKTMGRVIEAAEI